MFRRGEKRKNESDGDSSKGEHDWRPFERDVRRRSIKRNTMFAHEKKVPTDIIFEVGPASNIFKCHKHLLAFVSPVFEAMFFGPTPEKEDVIKVIDILPDGFEHMLQYIYGEEVCFESEMAAFHAWTAADKYCVNGLKEKCEAYLNNCVLTRTNFWMILENSVSFEIISVTNTCLKYLRSRILTFLRLPEFLAVSSDTLKKVSSIARTGITVLGFLRALLRWAKCKVENGEAESNLEVLSPILKDIHFGAMSSFEFSIFMSKSQNVISPQDAVAIFMHLSCPARFKLPDWCPPTTSFWTSEPSEDGENSYSRHSDVIPPYDETNLSNFEEWLLPRYHSFFSEEYALSLFNEYFQEGEANDNDGALY